MWIVFCHGHFSFSSFKYHHIIFFKQPLGGRLKCLMKILRSYSELRSDLFMVTYLANTFSDISNNNFVLPLKPRPLKPAAIHRDQNAANLTCKIYVAMYEEPAMHPKTK